MASPAFALAQDPAYLAFLRASGLSDEVAVADVARRKTGIQQALGLTTEDLEASGEQERRSISSSQESRGAFSSGETLQRNALQENSQARRRSALEMAAASGIGDLQSGLLQSQANSLTKGAELGLSVAANEYERAGEETYDLARRRT